MDEQIEKENKKGHVHDHIERDHIRISPSVLDCRLREFEQYAHAHANILQDAGLILAIYVPLASNGLNGFLGLSAATISGAFTFGLVYMISKTVYDVATVISERNRSSREALLAFLLKEEPKPSWVNRCYSWIVRQKIRN